MKISDLPFAVTAIKADWLGTDGWMGFTPRSGHLTARNNSIRTVLRQSKGGYVLEHITRNIEKPNPGYGNDPDYLELVQAHPLVAGKFVALHRLRQLHRPLPQILGQAEYDRLQARWARGEKRWRWSVAFPIIESFAIVPAAPANFGADTRTDQSPIASPIS